MPRTHRARPIVLILLGVLAILALAGTAVYAAGAAKPDFALGSTRPAPPYSRAAPPATA